MALKKKRLVKYIDSRNQKYRHPARYFFHLSIAPRRVLIPHKTSWNPNFNDHDRGNSMLFLTPLAQMKEWFGWVLMKYPDSEHTRVLKTLDKNKYVTLFVHIVEVDPEELIIPYPRFSDEVAIQRAVRPLAIIPIRYYLNKRLNLAKVSSTLEKIKYHQKEKVK
jgi:hypothetical protein